MGLFGSNTPLDRNLEQALVGGSGSDRKLLAKAQDGIRDALRLGERVSAVAIDSYSGSPMLLVTDRRLLVLGRGGRAVQHSFDPERIDQAVTNASGGVQVMGDGGNVVIRLRDYASGKALVRTINDTLLSRRPRTIPTLYPTFFLELLRAAGTPATPTNVSRFIERVFVMIKTQANTFFEQVGDPDAKADFTRRFANGGPEERILNSVDDMIDWLWQWNPGCHRALERIVQKIRDMLLEPHSFLYTNGGEIKPWSE